MIEISIILLVNILFFSKTLTYNYVSDDVEVAKLGHDKNKLKHWIKTIAGYEKHSPQVDHAIQIVLHALVCVGIYIAFGSNNISFWAAILFCFNPINSQASVWLSGRPYLFPTMALVWSLSFPFLSFLFLFIGSQFTLGVVSPLILLGFNLYFIFVIPFIWALRLKRFKNDVKNKINTQSMLEDKEIKLEKIIVAIKTFGFYSFMTIFPIKHTFYHTFLQSMVGGNLKSTYKIERFFCIGIIFITGIIYYFLTTEWNIISSALLWWCVGIAPFLNLYRMNQEIAERYVYLASVGLMFVLASFLPNHLIWFFVGLYISKLWIYMDSYKNNFYIAEFACLFSPSSWFAWHNKAILRWQGQSIHEATVYWKIAYNISPKEFKIPYNLSLCCFWAGNKKEAYAWLELAKQNIVRGEEKRSLDLIERIKNFYKSSPNSYQIDIETYKKMLLLYLT